MVCVKGFYSILSYSTLRLKVMIRYDMRGHRARDHMVVICITNHNQCLSPLTLWGVLDTILCDTNCQWLAKRSVVFSGCSTFPHHKHWPTWYNWNIVESGVKHNKNQYIYGMSRSHEGHDDKQHIVRGITHSYQISSA